jgi:hypothetical protein
MLDDELAEFRAANSREPSEDEMIGIEKLVLFSKEHQYVRLTQLAYISNFLRWIELTEKVEKEVQEESARENELLL